jgi:hypothetical protein
MRRSKLFLLAITGIASLGCQSTKMPRLVGPAPIGVQRQNAQDFDPYVQVDQGWSNTNTDIRPRDFTAPRSETVRAQQSPFARFSRWGKKPAVSESP